MTATEYECRPFDPVAACEVTVENVRIAGHPLIRVGHPNGVGFHLTPSDARVLTDQLLSIAHLITDNTIQRRRQ
ncbi:MAG: hypothetical protein WBA38_04270 [Gordonia sp. (in: high G+C Gram-positive bacteria)]|uniref:hypothetical protein n=1 Tax=Gordonia sp. (in: high G+C Gram-positive bacteria) TaxID=84139 RepID=UPI003C782D45